MNFNFYPYCTPTHPLQGQKTILCVVVGSSEGRRQRLRGEEILVGGKYSLNSYVGQRQGQLGGWRVFCIPSECLHSHISYFLFLGVLFIWDTSLILKSTRNVISGKKYQLSSWHLSADIRVDLRILVFKILVVLPIQRTRLGRRETCKKNIQSRNKQYTFG